MDWQTHQEANRAGTELGGTYLYFDTAAAAPPVIAAVEAASEYLWKTTRTGPYLPSLRAEIYAQLDEIRGRAASFLGATPEELAFTRNGTESISLVARGLRFEPGDEIIVPDTEMLSNIAIWRMVATESGATIVTVAGGPTGLLDPEAVRAAITERTKLLTFAALSNVTGAVQPVVELCEVAAAAGVLVHVNAAQAIGMMPVGFDVWPCDFISACTRKGLRAIEGSGVLAVREQHLDALTPTLAGWWNAGLGDGEDVTFMHAARKLEAGSPNVPAILALGAAIAVAEGLGVDAIHTRVRELTEYAATRLREIQGTQIYGPERDADRLGILPFNIDGCDPAKLTLALERRGIIIEAGHFMATPILAAYGVERMARVSLHYFNTIDEIDQLVAAIDAERGINA
ncbi:aminotransferase class V-fold PLP-dependent enzyme [Leucobacter komagatae]|uniref:Cysteine desulfurase n=1 Tax=Leucobacter komagatae TaxID=55969 RepID=A0A0D0HWQ8_9MICO|nr:aminotransferase class V-fold PLP-dependent enzyme [Leucobacter komagatae]KIP52011.1 cysteine desulfurase [Leucobacter komagatae]